MAAPDAPPLDIWEKVETDVPHRLAALRPGSHFFPAPLYLSIPRAHCERAGTRIHQRRPVHTER